MVTISKAGKLVIPRFHRATFNKPHGWSKGKVFIVLHHRKYTLLDNSGLTYKQLWRLSGVDRDYIRARAGVWCKYHYLNRRAVNGDNGHPIYTYTLAERGRRFVADIMPDDVLKEMIAEIREWRLSNE